MANGLFADWSPEQISGWLCRAYSNCDAMRVSHETIYKRLYMRTNEALGRDHPPDCATVNGYRGADRKPEKDAGSIVP